MARERGETLEQISRWAMVPPPCPNGCRFLNVATRDGESWEEAPTGITNLVTERVHVGPECLSFLMGYVYADLETRLHDLANAPRQKCSSSGACPKSVLSPAASGRGMQCTFPGTCSVSTGSGRQGTREKSDDVPRETGVQGEHAPWPMFSTP